VPGIKPREESPSHLRLRGDGQPQRPHPSDETPPAACAITQTIDAATLALAAMLRWLGIDWGEINQRLLFLGRGSIQRQNAMRERDDRDKRAKQEAFSGGGLISGGSIHRVRMVQK
jgi:hypothetical protein